MKKVLFGLLFAVAAAEASAVQCIVQGYYRADGTYVKSYSREQTSCKTTQFAGSIPLAKSIGIAVGIYLLSQAIQHVSSTSKNSLVHEDKEPAFIPFDTNTIPVQKSQPVSGPSLIGRGFEEIEAGDIK